MKGELVMSQAKELYIKVSNDTALQEEFTEIMKSAEEAGEEATKEKLIAFVKDAGYDITIEEMQAFFKDLAEHGKDELSDAELDMVAGGKAEIGLVVSFVSLGFLCYAYSMVGSCDLLGKDFKDVFHQ
jgi:predicted ribosomally synthesized peptide with nif11-like leader